VYVVRVNVSMGDTPPHFRWVGRDESEHESGFHTTRREKAHVFSTKAEAEEAVASYRRNADCDAVLEWAGPPLPEWLVEGARVAILGSGGPAWTVASIDGTEIGLTYPGDDHPAVWGLDRFLAAWGPVRVSRFHRDDPI